MTVPATRVDGVGAIVVPGVMPGTYQMRLVPVAETGTAISFWQKVWGRTTGGAGFGLTVNEDVAGQPDSK